MADQRRFVFRRSRLTAGCACAQAAIEEQGEAVRQDVEEARAGGVAVVERALAGVARVRCIGSGAVRAEQAEDALLQQGRAVLRSLAAPDRRRREGQLGWLCRRATARRRPQRLAQTRQVRDARLDAAHHLEEVVAVGSAAMSANASRRRLARPGLALGRSSATAVLGGPARLHSDHGPRAQRGSPAHDLAAGQRREHGLDEAVHRRVARQVAGASRRRTGRRCRPRSRARRPSRRPRCRGRRRSGPARDAAARPGGAAPRSPRSGAARRCRRPAGSRLSRSRSAGAALAAVGVEQRQVVQRQQVEQAPRHAALAQRGVRPRRAGLHAMRSTGMPRVEREVALGMRPAA